MLGFFLSADTLPASPHLLLWQHCHIPVLPHPWTFHQSQPLLLTGADCTATLTQTLQHLPSWAPQKIPSQHSPTLVCISHLPSSMQQFIPVSPCRIPFPPDCLHRLPACSSWCLIDAITPQHNPIREKFLSVPALRATNLVNPPHTQRVGTCLAKTESETLA